MHSRLIAIVASLLFALSATRAEALHITGHLYTTERGFPDNNIRCIAQDERGFMWFGSLYALYRYDGYTYTKLTPTNSGNNSLLMANHITELRRWRSGLLWIRQEGNHYSCYDCYANQFVDYTGCGRYNQTYERYKIEADSTITLYDRKNGCTTISYDTGRKSFNQSTHQRINPSTHQPLNVHPSTFTDNRGNIFTAENDGSVSFANPITGRKTSIMTYPRNSIKLNAMPRFKAITQSNGLVWITTYGNGLYIFNPKASSSASALTHITKHSHPQLLGSNFITAATEDSDGNVWISIEGYGVARLRANVGNFSTQYFSNDLTSERINEVRLLSRLADGRIIVGNNSGWLGTVGEDATMSITSKSTRHNYISAALDTAGVLWLGTRRTGVIVGTRGYTHSDTLPTSLSDNRIDHIFKDHRGRMWLCGIYGMLSLAVRDASGNITFQSFFKDRPHFKPRKMSQDSRRRIWLTSNNELLVFHPDSIILNPSAFRSIPMQRNDCRINTILCLYHDTRGNLWIGTDGHGLIKADSEGNILQTLTMAEGLANDVVYFIEEDAQGDIWAGTNDGCSVVDTTGTISNIYFGEDRRQNVFHEGCAVLLKDGNIVLGSRNGLLTVNGNAAARPQLHRWPITITGIEVNGSPLNVQPSSLNYNQNTITVRFSDFNYNEGHRGTRYSYMLEGYDEQWSKKSNLNFATYKNLPPGRYTLRIKRDSDNSQLQASFVISRPPWLSWWAFTIYAAIAIAVALISYRQIRTVYRLRQSIAVEKKLTEFKINFFTDISHEFRTPLTLIRATMDKMRSASAIPGELRQPVSDMQHNVNRMLRLINQLMEFRRMEEGRLSLSLTHFDIVPFLYDIVQTFRPAAEGKRITLQYLPQEKSRMITADSGHLDKIVYELLNNAFKYTPQGGSITLRSRYFSPTPNNTSSGQITIIVEDTGVGVPDNRKTEIFSRYTKGQHSSDSFGIGLNLTYELVKTHKGTIVCTDNPAGGAVFTVSIPATDDSYEEKDFRKSLINAAEGKQREERVVERRRETVADEQHISELPTPPMNHKRVLVVDDNADIISYLKKELSHYYIVHTATSGKEALSLIASQQQPDLVVSDVMMPGMSGFELTKRIKTTPNTAHIPVILLTALDGEERQYRGMEVGADAYITKPFSIRMLIMQCRNLMKLSSRSQQPSSQQEDKKEVRAVAEIITDERDRRLLNILTIWIDSHLADPNLSVDLFAREMKYGRTTFYSKIKQLTGKTPNDLIRERRLLRGAELLKGNNITVAEVTYQVGMSTPQYFSSCFKKHFGITPTQYQNGGQKKQDSLT